MRRKVIALSLFLVLLFAVSGLVQAETNIPKKKQTVLGLYVTAQEAFAKWHANPKAINIIDCRTPQEYSFVGHAPMAVNIPSKFMKLAWNEKKHSYVMAENKAFVSLVQKKFKPTDTIFIMCRSGGRSAQSVNKLAKAGFKKVYNVIDGFEGDKVKDKASYFNGKRMRNGWKNSGAPWTYSCKKGMVYLPAK